MNPATRLATRAVGRAVALAAAALLGLEAAVRLDDLRRFGTPLLSPYRSQDELVIRDADGMHGRPNARFRKFVMNSLGLRGPPATPDRPAGVLRVVTAGASETFGLYESPGREYPRQLEDSLAVALPERCRAIRSQVLNAAFPGMTLPTVVQDIRLRIRRYDPDIVLYYPTPAQYLADRPPSAAIPDSGGRSGTSGNERRSAIRALAPRGPARVLMHARSLVPPPLRRALFARHLRALASRHPPGWRFTTPPAERLAAFERDVRRLVGAVHDVGATPVLALRPHVFDQVPPDPRSPELLLQWQSFYPRATGATLLAFEVAARRAISRVAVDSGLAIADLPVALRMAPLPSFTDFAHLTDAGAAVVAGVLGRTIAMVAARGCAAP